MERLDIGAAKWGALAATIIALEVLPLHSESLTHACGRALDTKIGKLAVPAVMAVTVAHLMDWIPHQYDPFYITTDIIDAVSNITLTNRTTSV